MPTISTGLSARQDLEYLFSYVKKTHKDFTTAKPGDTKTDEALLADSAQLEKYLMSFDKSAIEKIFNDSNYAGGSREKLIEIKKMLKEISEEKRLIIRKEHYLHKFAKHLEHVVNKMMKKTRVKGVKELKKVVKEKKELSEKEKEAKEKIGK